MRHGNFNSFRCKSLIFVCLSFITFGCVHNVTTTGTIYVSQPKVWREDAIMMSTGRQIAELRKFEENVNLSAAQGERIREFISRSAVDVSLSAGSSEGQGTKSPAQSDTDKAGVVQKTENRNLEFTDEPLDGLQRVDDFYGAVEGTLLAYLRDSSSQRPGYALYLLGFDISVLPSPATRTGYDGYLQFEIVPFKEESKVKEESKDSIQIYSVSPQRHAERFSEAFGVRRIIETTLKAAAKRGEIGGELSIDLERQLSDKLSKLERYPIISGFMEGPRTFGWIFHPRAAIAKSGKKIEYSLEPGIRHCYALILVNDGSIDAPKWFYIIDDKFFKERIEDKDTAWFRELLNEYQRIFCDVESAEAKKEAVYITNHLLKKAFLKLGRLIELCTCNSGKSCDLNIETEKFVCLEPEEANEEKKLDSLKKECKKASDQFKKQSEDLKKLSELFGTLHKAVLGFIGRHGKFGTRAFNLKVSSRWVRDDCRWYNLDCGEIISSPQEPLTVVLPDKVDRTLVQSASVWPKSAPGNEETWVSIKGQGFTNDPQVFVGRQKAIEVLVVSRDLILAKFPKSKLAECHMVKVYAGGEAMVSAGDAFCYKSPLLEEPTPKFRVTGIHPQEGGAKSKLKIEANRGVMDKVEKVVIGEMDVSLRELKEGYLQDDNHAIEIVLPELPKDTPAGSVEIRLFFKKDTDIVPGDRYIVPFGFKYLR